MLGNITIKMQQLYTSNIEMWQLNHSERKHSLRIKGAECGNNECSN